MKIHILLFLIFWILNTTVQKRHYCDRRKNDLELLRQTSWNTVAIDLAVIQEHKLADVQCCIYGMYTSALATRPQGRGKCYKVTLSHPEWTYNDSVLIEARCSSKKGGKRRIIYEDFFFMPQKKNVQKRIPKQYKQALSVLIIGIDGVSWNGFKKNAVNARRTLLRKGAIEFTKYNGIDTHTHECLMPLLTGMTSSDTLRSGCVSRKDFSNCELIWKYYSRKGYVTAFGEDMVDLGLFDISYALKNQSTDFDYRSFDLKLVSKNGHAYTTNNNVCVLKKFIIERLLRNIAIFAATFKHRPYFGFFWGATLTHDFRFVPKELDIFLSRMLQFLHANDVFTNTLFILMSDHGPRFSNSSVHEKTLPFLYMLFPKNMQKTRKHAQLKRNAHELLTTSDIRATLLDLLGSNDHVSYGSRGLSFLRPLPQARSCRVARIPDKHCRF